MTMQIETSAPEVVTFRGLTAFFELAGVSVTSNQLYMWHQRKKANGFPDPVACLLKTQPGCARGTPMFSTDEVFTWWLQYDVKKQLARGGAPKGNTYASTHHKRRRARKS